MTKKKLRDFYFLSNKDEYINTTLQNIRHVLKELKRYKYKQKRAERNIAAGRQAKYSRRQQKTATQ
jgi:hypothetical protein